QPGHFAGDVGAQDVGQGIGGLGLALAGPKIQIVQGGGAHLQENLARPRLGDGHLLQPENGSVAEFMDANSLHSHASAPPGVIGGWFLGLPEYPCPSSRGLRRCYNGSMGRAGGACWSSPWNSTPWPIWKAPSRPCGKSTT